MFGMTIDALRMNEAIHQLLCWLDADRTRLKYLVTPNVDHVVNFQKNERFREAYAKADIVLVDGKPLLWASRLLGIDIPETIPGSDLVPALFDASARGGSLTVYLLGAGPGVADRAATRISRRWPHMEVIGTYSPPFGFENQEEENRKIIQQIRSRRPDLLIVGLGAPKQEIWVSEHANDIGAKVALCVGASIDFFAGERCRAPSWMRKVGLEWLHRMMTDPRRLVRRYFRDLMIFPGLVFREWLQNITS
jgi:N-acetylglucosaminyldiphosphoundecaprenol N-acetyl-beta-D-mannosaminyltransferase